MRYLVFFSLLLLGACSDGDKSDISTLLDSRDAAISNQDLASYAHLLQQEYRHDQGGAAMAQMQHIFSRFERVKMVSRDREIRIINAHEAMCEQTYVLKVFADGDWRDIIQREQLLFQRVDGVWKISAGL